MSLDPKEVASFADLVAKMNSIDAGKTVKPKSNHIKEGMKANSMNAILESMYGDTPFESAKGLPAEYDMPNVSPVLGSDTEKNPYGDYFVGEDFATDIDIKDKGEYDQEGEMAKGQLNSAADAALELQSILDDDENLPEWVQSKIVKALDYLDTARDYMKQELGEGPNPGDEESWDGVSPDTDQTLSGPINPASKKAELPEDKIDKKKSIMDYLSDVEKQRNEEMLAEPVKTFKTDDGKELKVYGSEDDGYRVKVNGKESKKSFGRLSDAVMACETFVQRSRDYASEK